MDLNDDVSSALPELPEVAVKELDPLQVERVGALVELPLLPVVPPAVLFLPAVVPAVVPPAVPAVVPVKDAVVADCLVLAIL